MADSVVWQARPREYEREKRGRAITPEEASSHPLKEIVVTMSESKTTKSAPSDGKAPSFTDPLSRSFEGVDPLSQFAATSTPSPRSAPFVMLSKGDKKSKKPGELGDDFEPWSAKRSSILSRYTTTEKLSIVTILAPSSDRKEVASGTVSEKVKNRLEQLDDLEEGAVQETLNLSQQDYIHRIEEMNNSLIVAWDEDQRVKSLKIAIQCAKLLADTSVIQFYPSKFVLITDILDTFGTLVYDRIADKAALKPKGGAFDPLYHFTPEQVPDSAKETCRNWFFKIASIRELIPRFYVEAAILQCYSFLTTGEYNRALKRLALMTRGIGDPLVAAYARCYLCRVGVTIAPSIRDHLAPCFDDLLSTFVAQSGTDAVQNALALQHTDVPHYLVLYAPALNWVLQCLSYGADESVLDSVLARCPTLSTGSTLLLNAIMTSFRPGFIAARAMEFARMIRDSEESGFPKHLLHRALGMCIAVADPPEEQKLQLLNEVWKAVTKLKSPSEYIGCVEVWIEYVLKCFGRRELNTVLGDIIKHMTPDRAYEEHYPQLQSIMSKILARRTADFADLFSHDKFMPFLDMFQKESVKVEVCKNIMETYLSQPREVTSDPVVMHTLMSVCRTMHDFVNALSVDDDVRAIAALIINGLIRNISFGQDLEQQLAFYVECRAAFCNIDPVLKFLVHAANQVAAEVHRGATKAGGHNRRTASFARACAAYAFITIPSLNGVFHRLSLYLESGNLCLLNQCLSQADAFFRAAIALIPTVPRFLEMDGKIRATEPLLVDYINDLMSALVTVPDSPDQGMLYLLRGLLNVVQDYSWDANADSKYVIYTSALALLSTFAQESLPYRITGIDANDALYGGDQQFIGEIELIAETLVREIAARIKELDDRKRRSQLALDLFSRITAHADLNNESIFKMAVSLWSIVVGNTNQLDVKLVNRVSQSVSVKGTTPDGVVYARLAKEMRCQNV